MQAKSLRSVPGLQCSTQNEEVMIREDIISQMIQQIAALVARILNLNLSQESMEEELNGLAEKWIGLPSSLLLSLPPEEAFRLLEDSDRMVIEKSYFMGEMYRMKGLKSESPSAKKTLFGKALFFYGKCSGQVSEKLQDTIDKTVEELKLAGSEEPYSEPEGELKDSLQVLESQRFESLPASTNRHKKRTTTILWCAITACLLAIGVYSLFDENEIEITDRISGFEDGLAQAEFQIVNNTDQERLIRLRLSVEHSTRDVFGSEHTFLGSVEREYNVAPQSTRKIAEEFEYFTKSPRANQTISIAVLSNISVDTNPVIAPSAATHIPLNKPLPFSSYPQKPLKKPAGHSRRSIFNA